MAQMLEALSVRCGQPGAMRWVEYALSTPSATRKIPTLVLTGLRPGIPAAEARAEDVSGAALLYEYRLLGLRTRVFATDNTVGWGTVIASAECRAETTLEACRALLRQGACAVLATFEGSAANLALHNCAPVGCSLGWRDRIEPRQLLLAGTLDATLATLGRHTRRNLRYYRRRLEAEIGVSFVPAVRIPRADFLALNRASIHPVTEALAAWRYASIFGEDIQPEDNQGRTAAEGTFLVGLRSRTGHWLSLVGGRRHRRRTEIDWQINRAGFERYSLSTAMRTYLLEHEVRLGTRELAFTGGTPHSVRHSFACVEVADVVALAHSLEARALRRLAPWVLPRKNFLREALHDRGLHWTEF